MMMFDQAYRWSAAISRALLFSCLGVVTCVAAGCSAAANDPGPDPTAVSPEATAPVDRLLILDDQILAPDHTEIKLRGWNWGQWNTILAGDQYPGYPGSRHNDPSDGADAVTQGANVVRILLRWWGEYGPDNDNMDRFGKPIDSRDEVTGTAHVSNKALALLDDMITEATSHGVWVVLAVDSNCGQESPSDADLYCSIGGAPHRNFNNDTDMRNEFKDIWTYLANTYKNHDHIAMYEILPEPQFGCSAGPDACDYAATRAFYTELIGTIRNQDSRTPILVGPGSGYAMKHIEDAFITDPGNSMKLIYTANMLSQGALSMDQLGTFLNFRCAHHVPVIVQQVGILQSDVKDQQGHLDPMAYRADVANVLSELDGDDIGWTWWTYRDQRNGDGYAPWYLSAAPDTWSAAVTPDMLTTITTYFHDVIPTPPVICPGAIPSPSRTRN
jgi:hypothetical protein